MTCRLAAVLVLLALLLVPAGALAANGPGGPRSSGAGSPTPSASQLDPVFALLRPDDVGQPGYEMQASYSDSAESLGLHLNQPGLAFQLEQDGFVRRYSQNLALPSADNPNQVGDRFIGSFIEVYDSAAGAAQGFKLGATLNKDVAADATTIGDQSQVSREPITNPDTHAPMQAVGLLAQVANLLVMVQVADATAQPSDAEVYPLVTVVLNRIAAATSPNLSLALRLSVGQAVEAIPDGYLRIAGQTLPLLGLPETEIKPRDVFYGNATDVYQAFQQLPVPGSRYAGVLGFYALALPDAPSASAALKRYAAYNKSNPSTTALSSAHGVGPVGDESVATSYTVTDQNGGETYGVAVAFRIGTRAYVVFARSEIAPTTAAMTKLAKMELTCVRQGGDACNVKELPAGVLNA